MMFSGRKSGPTTSSLFKWHSRGKSSLNSELVVDVPPEIELSDYQRLASSGSDSPSGFLNGEGLKIDAIPDLDIFLERLYSYYCQKGLWCIIVKWNVEILSLLFILVFSFFILLVVDWHGLSNVKCGIDAVESGTKPCDLAKEALHSHPLVPFTLSKGIILGYLAIFTIYLLFCFMRFFAQLKDILETRHFFNNTLNVSDRDLQTTPWPVILEKIVDVQHSQQLCVVKDLSCHEMIMRIMRKENYLIGMLNKGLLAFPVPSWIPGAGPAMRSGSSGKKHHLVLTKTLEWTINWCILQSMFDRNYCIRTDFISNPSLLRKRLVIVGIMMFLLSPFLIIFMLVYFFLRHAEQFYNHPSTASSRRWSNISRWIFREFNEVDHFFRHRINSGVVHACEYLKQFPSPIISLIAKLISFISGGFAAVLIIIAFFDESLLEGHIFGRNLFWYAAVFGTVTAISRAAVSDDLPVLDPEEAMSLVVQHTHYLPKKWRGKENTDSVRLEFETLFQYTGMMLLEEMVSIFLTPYLLVFVVPNRVDDILRFISDITVDIEGVGHVCSFSTFDFEIHGNSKYGSPYNAPRDRRSSQGKMEKSFLSFHNVYSSWQPNSQGQQFLSNLRNFREEHVHQEPQNACSPLQPGNPTTGSSRQVQLFHRFPSRGATYGNAGVSRPVYDTGSLWMINPQQRTHPYLLDWYYMTQPVCGVDNPRHATLPSASPAAATVNFWQTSDAGGTNKEEEENWKSPTGERLRSSNEESTSKPFTRDSIFHHFDSGDLEEPTQSHWWVRQDQQVLLNPPTIGTNSVRPETSFIEPPNFGQLNFNNHGGASSEILEEEEEDEVSRIDLGKSHTLSRTTYLDGCEEDEAFNLPFNDVYTAPPRNLPFSSETTDNVSHIDDSQGIW